MKIIIIIIQLSLFILMAPFLSGLISKIKNNIRMRKGQSVFQPYYNLAKLFSKEEVVSVTASWIFKCTPFVVLASMLIAALLLPVIIMNSLQMGDFLALIFIFALGRFFMALAALDTGSSFGGMGASREMFISTLVEPTFCLVVFSVFLQFGTTNIAAFSGDHSLSIASIVGAISLFLITLAETSRIPVDNQETHLELTMVHEAMVLEYSGRYLAFIELAAHIKQMVLFFLIAQLILPINFIFFSIFWYVVCSIFIAILVALVEVLVAKMRLFRVTDFLGFAFVLAMISVVCAVLGV